MQILINMPCIRNEIEATFFFLFGYVLCIVLTHFIFFFFYLLWWRQTFIVFLQATSLRSKKKWIILKSKLILHFRLSFYKEPYKCFMNILSELCACISIRNKFLKIYLQLLNTNYQQIQKNDFIIISKTEKWITQEIL